MACGCPFRVTVKWSCSAAFVLGAGAATPAAFAVCGLVLLCFSVGYAAMSRRITSAGGFYPYVARGLGKPPAVAAALVAVIAYNAVAVELVAGLGYFGQLVVQQQTGVNLPWELYAASGVVAAALLGYRTIDIGARLLAVLMIAEIGILLVLDIAVLAAKGGAALPATSFAPHTFLHGGGSVGIGLMFAFGAYVGFESAALYGEESKNPRRSVPLATSLRPSTSTWPPRPRPWSLTPPRCGRPTCLACRPRSSSPRAATHCGTRGRCTHTGCARPECRSACAATTATCTPRPT